MPAPDFTPNTRPPLLPPQAVKVLAIAFAGGLLLFLLVWLKSRHHYDFYKADGTDASAGQTSTLPAPLPPDLASGDGVLRRIDRLVEFDDAIWVLDYKSSGSDTLRLGEYREQVSAYCQAVAGVFPGKTVHGGLIFADGVLVEIH